MIQLNPETAILLPTQLGLLNLYSMPALQPLKKTQTIHKIIHILQNIHVYFMTKVNNNNNNNFIYIALKSNNCPKRYLITKRNIKNLNYKISTIYNII